MKIFKLIALLSSLLASSVFADELLNVSYDPTREFYLSMQPPRTLIELSNKMSTMLTVMEKMGVLHYYKI